MEADWRAIGASLGFFPTYIQPHGGTIVVTSWTARHGLPPGVSQLEVTFMGLQLSRSVGPQDVPNLGCQADEGPTGDGPGHW